MSDNYIESDDPYLPCPKCRGKEAERRYLYPHTTLLMPDGSFKSIFETGLITVTCVRCKYILAMMPPADHMNGDLVEKEKP